MYLQNIQNTLVADELSYLKSKLSILEDSIDLSAVIEKTENSIVSINGSGKENPSSFFDVSYSLNFWNKETSGLGVIVDKEKGIIITCNHIINDLDDIKIKHPSSNKEFSAKVLFQDIRLDIAILESTDLLGIKGIEELSLLSNDAPLGTEVMSFSADGTIKSGTIGEFKQFIKDDINIPKSLDIDLGNEVGDSGAPVIDSLGQLLGIVTATNEETVSTLAISSRDLSAALSNLNE